MIPPRHLPEWPAFARHHLDDGRVNVSDLSHPFPGYVAHPEYPFLPQQTLTHPRHDTHQLIGHYSFGDSPDEHEKNLAKMGPDWHYAHKTVTYHVNRNGYRAPEWDSIAWQEAIVIFGCSMTYGIGVAQDETLNHYLEQLTGRPVINMGYPSGTNDLMINNMCAMIENFGYPCAVVSNWTTMDRFMFYSSHPITVGLWTDSDANVDGVKLQRLYKDTRFNEQNINVRAYYQAKLAENLWRDRCGHVSISYFKSSAHYMRAHYYIEADMNARDLIHAGPETHKRAAQTIFEHLTNHGFI